MKKLPPKHGMFKGLPFSQYLAIDAVSNSYLKKLAITPAHAKDPDAFKDSAATIFGRAGHILILEGEDEFNKQVIEADAGTITAKAYEKVALANPKKTVVLRDDVDTLKRIRDAVYSHPTARDMLEKSREYRELTMIWQDPETGLWCKCRQDLVVPETRIMGDLKILREGAAEPRRFYYEVRDGYGFQAAFYYRGARATMNLQFEDFGFIVVEKAPPFRVEVHVLDPQWFELMEPEINNRLRTEKECREKGFWPNYQHAGSDMIGAPRLDEAI